VEAGLLTTLVKRSARRLLRYAGYDVVRLRTPVRVAPTAPEAKPITETDALALAELRRAFPFPEVEPHIRPFFSSLDGGGRDLVVEVIQERRAKQILEIGAFLGGSAELWLRSWPEAVVICIDHWPDADAARAQGGTSAGDYAARSGYPEAQPQLDRPGGFFQTFLANLIYCKDRVIPVRAESPGVLCDCFCLERGRTSSISTPASLIRTCWSVDSSGLPPS
jgi:hypothetical protein